MSAEVKVPMLGESVTTATISRWFKQPGEAVAVDEPLVELETSKVTIDIAATEAGVLLEHRAAEGEDVEVGDVIALIGAADGKPSAPAKGKAAPPPPALPPSAPAQPCAPASVAQAADVPPMPAARKMMAENGLNSAQIGRGQGKGGRVTKADVQAFLNAPPSAGPAPAVSRPARQDDPREERIKMTRLRRTIAQRLKEAQNTAAMLTTFNEVDMSALKALRARYRDAFEKKNNGTRLGFMSFFVSAAVAALKEFPALNAEIDGDEVIYRNFVNMGIAVGGSNGLVVPVLRDADQMSFAEIEAGIADFGKRARAGALRLDELTGGTFSITNGGIYGSLMSTPILNAPQSAILGMHAIVERPVAVNGQVEIRPMMYLALSYDHRIVDGKEAVSFLVRIKEGIEDPSRLLLGV